MSVIVQMLRFAFTASGRQTAGEYHALDKGTIALLPDREARDLIKRNAAEELRDAGKLGELAEATLCATSRREASIAGLSVRDVLVWRAVRDEDTWRAAQAAPDLGRDPSILGTLFERGLDPDKRSQLGAHYTDRDKIMMIVGPVIVEPLSAEWEKAKAEITAFMDKAAAASGAAATRAKNQAQAVLDRHLARLAAFRVLDPACGSGNFLYLALRTLKDLEHRAQVEAEALGLPRSFPRIGPEVVKGIEINPYAAELARVSVWIGEIQWMIANGFAASRDPILKPLQTIECRDALLTPDGEGWREAEWPAADAIIGNPPFVGAKVMKRVLGVEETERIRAIFADRLPAFTDLVCYWFEKARAAIAAGRSSAAGLIATKSIAKNTNLPVMRPIGAPSGIMRSRPLASDT